jgi:DNA-3-methyladenine glycosylase
VPSPGQRVSRADLPADTLTLARWLVGVVVVHHSPSGLTSGRIVECEAYPIGDPAGHAFRGRTPSNTSLFLDRGHAYVYRSYGVHWCLNVVAEHAGAGAGVLLRAIEPLAGVALMEQRRATTRRRDLARGPGNLTQALGVDKTLDGLDLADPASPLWLEHPSEPVTAATTIRIGLTREMERPYRFYAPGSPYVSGPNRLL